MPYRVAARPPRAGHWILSGPVFGSLDEAHQYLETLREPVARLVRTHDAAPALLPQRSATRIEGRVEHASPRLHPGLDRRRLEYVRYLLATSRLQEW